MSESRAKLPAQAGISARKAHDIPLLADDKYIVMPHYDFHVVSLRAVERFSVLALLTDDVAPNHSKATLVFTVQHGAVTHPSPVR